MGPHLACNDVLLCEIEWTYKLMDLSNVLTVHVVKHFFLNEEGTIEVLDEALSEASVLTIVKVATFEVDVALAKAVLDSAQVSLMRRFNSLVLCLELTVALEGLGLFGVELILLHIYYIIYFTFRDGVLGFWGDRKSVV